MGIRRLKLKITVTPFRFSSSSTTWMSMQEFEDFVTQTQQDLSFRGSISKFGSIFLQVFNKL